MYLSPRYRCGSKSGRQADTHTVRLKILGNAETMHDPDLHTFLIISLRIIFKRTVHKTADKQTQHTHAYDLSDKKEAGARGTGGF